MLHLRISVPTALTDQRRRESVRRTDGEQSRASMRGASIKPAGDVVTADITREHANGVLGRLRDLGVARDGTLHVDPVPSLAVAGRRWTLRPGLPAARPMPKCVWPEVGARAYSESELNGTYLVFMIMATLHRRHRDRPRLADPHHRRHGAGSGVRADRGAGAGAGSSAAGPPRAGRPHAARRLRRGDRRDGPRRPLPRGPSAGSTRRPSTRRDRGRRSSITRTSGRSSSPYWPPSRACSPSPPAVSAACPGSFRTISVTTIPAAGNIALGRSPCGPRTRSSAAPPSSASTSSR